MMIYRFLFIIPVLLVGCASGTHQDSNRAADKQLVQQKQQKRPVPSALSLSHMDTQFLYISAHQALGNNQPGLAVRFFKALVKKEPNAIIPRFELVDVLLAGGPRDQADAKETMESMPKDVVAQLEGDDLSEYQQLYARSLIANGQAVKAASLLEAMLEKQPDRVAVRLLLVRLYAIDKQYDKAHATLNTGLKRGKVLSLQNMQVQLYLQQAKVKAADNTLAAMQKEYPEHEDIVLQRAHLAEKTGQGVRAESLLQGFIQKHPDSAVQSYNMLAGIYVRQNRLTPAIATYKTLLHLTGDDAEVLMSLGKLYYQQQKFTEARGYFKRAVAQLKRQKGGGEPSEALASASFYYGASLEASHQWEEAVPQYEILKPKHVLYVEAQLRLASIDLTHKKLKQAEERLLHLKEIYPTHMGVYEMLSSLRLQQKQYKQLIAESDKILDSNFSQTLLFNRAVAFEKLQQFGDLDKALDAILAQDPNDAETLNFYGYSLADRGIRLNDAQRMIEQALTIKPKDGFYLDSLAWVYFKQQEYNKALAMQLDAVKEIQADPVMMEHLGDIYWRKNQAEDARKSWQKAIEFKHDEPSKIEQKIERGLM